MSQSSEIAATTESELVSPEGTQEGKNTCHLAAIRLPSLPMVSPEKAQGVKTGFWPQIVEVCTKEIISVSPGSCNFPYIPIYRKVLNSSTWGMWLTLTTKTFFFPFIFICWRLITLQYCSGFCHTLTWISHGFTCVPHPDPPSHLPPHPIPLGHPSAPALSTCFMYPTWTGDHKTGVHYTEWSKPDR